MTNIPTELLRTLVAVVDQRSFTKAAQLLGVTQPAVSAQIKRLQGLLADDLLDRRGSGVVLTSAGMLVVNYARRLLTINDEIVTIAGARSLSQTLRIGTTADFAAADIGRALARFRIHRPQARFVLTCGTLDVLARDLSEGTLDVAVWMSARPPAVTPRHDWAEDMVWLRAADAPPPELRPLPLVAYAEFCPFTRDAVAALNAAGHEHELVLMVSSMAGLAAAVAAGIGVTALPSGRATMPGIAIWHDAPLPKLAAVRCGIAVRDGADPQDRELLADVLMQTMQRPDDVAIRAAIPALEAIA